MKEQNPIEHNAEKDKKRIKQIFINFAKFCIVSAPSSNCRDNAKIRRFPFQRLR